MTRVRSAEATNTKFHEGWEKYEQTAESDPGDGMDFSDLVDVGDIPLVGELAGKWFWNATTGRFQKTRRRSRAIHYQFDDRRGHSAYAREIVRWDA